MFVDLAVLADGRFVLARPDGVVPNLAGGMPRAALPSGLFVPLWLFAAIGPFQGFVANQIIIRIVAYIGMQRLLSKHVFREPINLPSTLAALTFAILPFYSLFGLSIAGQPLLLSAFLAIRGRRGRPADWLVVGSFPFYSVFAFSGFFIIPLLALAWLRDLVCPRTMNRSFAAAVLLFVAMSLAVEYPTLWGMFGKEGFTSHRVEIRTVEPTVERAYDAAFLNFIYGQEHAPSIHRRVLLPTAALSLLILATAAIRTLNAGWKRRAAVISGLILACAVGLLLLQPDPLRALAALYIDRQPLEPQFKYSVAVLEVFTLAGLFAMARLATPVEKAGLLRLLSLIAIAAAISFWYGSWLYVWKWMKSFAPGLPYANLSRFHYFHPTIWYVVLGVALAIIGSQTGRIGKPVVIAAGVLQMALLFWQAEARTERAAGNPSFGRFFAKELFAEIDRAIARDKSSYRVCSVGLFPSIATYNGFHTLDGYSQNYPLTHKRRFRRIIAGELDRSPELREYYDGWGSRYYVFSHEIRDKAPDAAFLLTAQTVDLRYVTVTDLRFDVAEFRALGGRYVFSAVEIGNASELGLTFVKMFERNDAPWRIFLYSSEAGDSDPIRPTT